MALTDKITEDWQRVVLVEGQDDAEFLYEMAKSLNLTDKLFIYPVDGMSKFRQELIALLQSEQFTKLQYLGLVKDADTSTTRFEDTCNQLDNLNLKNPRRQFPIPTQAQELTGDTLKLSIMILPTAGATGMLEDLIIQAHADDPFMVCAEAYFECFAQQNMAFRENRIAKAKTNIFIAGKSVDARFASTASELKHIYHQSWWSWDNPIFDDAKRFLLQLASD